MINEQPGLEGQVLHYGQERGTCTGVCAETTTHDASNSASNNGISLDTHGSGALNSLFQALESMNNFLKAHDPLPNFPLPTADAMRMASMPSSSFFAPPPVTVAGASSSIDAMAAAAGNSQANRMWAAGTGAWSAGQPTWATAPHMQGGNVQQQTFANAPEMNMANQPQMNFYMPPQQTTTTQPSWGTAYTTGNVATQSSSFTRGVAEAISLSYDSTVKNQYTGTQSDTGLYTSPFKSSFDSTVKSPYSDLFTTKEPGLFNTKLATEPSLFDPFATKDTNPFKVEMPKLHTLDDVGKHTNFFEGLKMPEFKVDPNNNFGIDHFKQAWWHYNPSANSYEWRWQEQQKEQATHTGQTYYDREGRSHVGTESSSEDLQQKAEAKYGGGTYYDRHGRPHGMPEGYQEPSHTKTQSQEQQDTLAIGLSVDHPDVRRALDEERAQHMTNARRSLTELFVILPAFGLIVDMEYIYSILSLPADLAAQVLKAIALEVLIEKARWQKEDRPKVERETASSTGSGGGDDNNSTDADADEASDHKRFSFDAEVEQALKDALNKWDVNALVDALKQSGWTLDRSAFDKVPEHLRRGNTDITRDKLGIRFEGLGKLEGDGIRIEKGKPWSRWSSQHQDYVRVNSGGKVLGKDGKVLSDKDYEEPSHHPDAHIPLNEWMQWQRWNEK